MSRYVADLDKLREYFGYDSWYVFGHSFGARLDLEYAAAHPDRVTALIYCSGVGLDWATQRSVFPSTFTGRVDQYPALTTPTCGELSRLKFVSAAP
jgi:proline iminopeptidase